MPCAVWPSPLFREEEEEQDFKTKAVFHLLGWSFESQEATGSQPNYKLDAKAAVPVASEKFVALDRSEVAVEIFQILPEGRRLLYVGSEFLTTMFNVTPLEDGSSKDFMEALKNYTHGLDYKLRLHRPGVSPKAKTDEIKKKEAKDMEEEVLAEVNVSFSSQSFEDKSKKHPAGEPGAPLPCCSPELLGGGVNTTLFTSNRAAWFDPSLGAGKFRPGARERRFGKGPKRPWDMDGDFAPVSLGPGDFAALGGFRGPDHVANFVELTLSSLSFPPAEKDGDRDRSNAF
ncbi:unnamed protein product [Effrenium voratum]|uniref:Uncharacterized protein n=1 Tax=Effrenium voratum TaxID=2562239 RepID=A0AA36NB85_9DINO|nr:unnamed protein product [Effrenium voratum]